MSSAVDGVCPADAAETVMLFRCTNPHQFLLDRAVGDEDGIVLVLPRRLSLGREDADDAERLVANANDLPVGSTCSPNSVSATTEPSTATLRGLCVLLREMRPKVRRPGPDERHVDAGALDARRPVLIAGDDLRARVRAGRDVLARRAGPESPRRRRRSACSTTPGPAERRRTTSCPRSQGSCCAGRLDLVFDLRLRAGPERDHHDHGGDADDHPQHRQRRASLFLPSALSAMRTVIRSDMIFVLGWRQEQPVPRWRAGAFRSADRGRSGRRGMKSAGCHNPRCRLVRDEQDRDAAVGVEPLENIHHLDARARIEVASRLVREDDCSSLMSARAIAARCCCPPDG